MGIMRKDPRSQVTCDACGAWDVPLQRGSVDGLDVNMCSDPKQCRIRGEKLGVWRVYTPPIR